MTTLRKVTAIAVVALTAFALADSGRVELLAKITGIGKGKVSWKTRDKGNQREAELEAEGEKLTRNATYSLTIGTNAPIAVTTNGFGSYNLSQRFTTVTRPTISAGDAVTLSDANGVVVESGVMQPK